MNSEYLREHNNSYNYVTMHVSNNNIKYKQIHLIISDACRFQDDDHYVITFHIMFVMEKLLIESGVSHEHI